MVVGVGVLGNEVFKNLVFLGVGYIVFLDFDYVEYFNFSWLVFFWDVDCGCLKVEVVVECVCEINFGVEIIFLYGDVIYDIGLGFIGCMYVVIGCLDNCIVCFYINCYCYKMNCIWVDGGIENLVGCMDVFIFG